MYAELSLARIFGCPSPASLHSRAQYLDRRELLGVRRESRAWARTFSEPRPPLLFQRRSYGARVCFFRGSCEKRIAIPGRGFSGPSSLLDMLRRHRDIYNRRISPVLGGHSWVLLYGCAS